MKILQFGKLFPPDIGGIESVMHDLTEGLARIGVQVDVLCASSSNRTSTTRDRLGYAVTRTATIAKVFSTSISPGLVRELRKRAPLYDVIHLHAPDPMAFLAVWATRPKCKIVLHWHADVGKSRLLQIPFMPLQEWVLNRADAIVATSSAYATFSPLLQRFKTKVVVIPIGISDPSKGSCSHKQQAIRARYGGKHLVFALGRLIPYKGFEYLIDAARALPQDTVILIGGDGPLRNKLLRRIRRANLLNVFLLGKIPKGDIGSYYQCADLFCLPSISRAEAFGVVLLEAMAHGKALITTRIPGSATSWVNLHGETGMTVPMRDSLTLARTIQYLTETPSVRRNFALQARARFISEFTSTAMVDRVIELYQRVLGRNDIADLEFAIRVCDLKRQPRSAAMRP